MRMRLILPVITLALSLLSGCHNRFEEYEPYSAFDERMAAEGLPEQIPDDQMTPMMTSDPSADYRPQAISKPSVRSGASGGGSSIRDNDEVPFASSRNTKHAYNVGALQ